MNKKSPPQKFDETKIKPLSESKLIAKHLLNFITKKEKKRQNKMKTYANKREYDNDNPSGMYVCTNCGTLTNDKYNCRICGWRADGLLKTQDKGFKYTIVNENFTDEIFTPIEQTQKA